MTVSFLQVINNLERSFQIERQVRLSFTIHVHIINKIFSKGFRTKKQILRSRVDLTVPFTCINDYLSGFSCSFRYCICIILCPVN